MASSPRAKMTRAIVVTVVGAMVPTEIEGTSQGQDRTPRPRLELEARVEREVREKLRARCPRPVRDTLREDVLRLAGPAVRGGHRGGVLQHVHRQLCDPVELAGAEAPGGQGRRAEPDAGGVPGTV